MAKGYPSTDAANRTLAEFPTVEPVRDKQNGITQVSHMYVRKVGSTDQAEANSTDSVIVATSHLARRGDIVYFRTGSLSGMEFKVQSTDTNSITVAEAMPSAPAVGNSFEILRHKYPQVDSDGNIVATSTSGPLQFELDGTNQVVIEDTATPANSRPLPVKFGGSLPAGTNNIGDVDVLSVPSSVTTPLSSIATNTTGLNLLTKDAGASDPTTLRVKLSDEDVTSLATPEYATGAGGVSGITLRTKLTDEDATYLSTTKTSVDAVNTSVGLVNTSVGTVNTSVSTVNTSVGTVNTSIGTMSAKLPATLGQKTMANSMAVALASDQSSITVKAGGKTAVNKARNDYTSVNVTTSAYVQLIASTASAITELEIFDSSGQTLVLATGAAASEADQIYITPGGNGRVPLTIAASARVSIKAVSATASAGEIVINFYS